MKTAEKLVSLAKANTTESRIDFLVTAFSERLIDKIEGYELWDAGYEVGPRDLDNCVENDGCAQVEKFGEDQLSRWTSSMMPKQQPVQHAPTPQLALF